MRILIVVQTALALEAGEQVFLTGSPAELGQWNPAAVPLTRTDDNRWEAWLNGVNAAPFEFKITRGSWASEEVNADGAIPPNRKWTPADGESITVTVADWLDRLPVPTTPQIVGDYHRLPQIHSQHLEHDRDVIVWLPPGYDARPTRRYPVLYMHDGRQVFDPTTSTWGKDWQVDEHAQNMILTGELEPFIVVAIDCTDARATEYSPAHKGNEYLRFLIEELKPHIDAEWRTDPDRTAIAGASLGGLISFYAAWKHPNVFFGAACLSPALVERYGKECFPLVSASQDNLPDIKLFLSCGGTAGLEAELLEGTLKMADLLRNIRFPEKNLSVRIESWAEHNEEAWARMTPHWLRFLFGHTQPAIPDPGNPR